MFIIGTRVIKADARGRRLLNVATTPTVHVDEELAIEQANQFVKTNGGQYEVVIFKAVAVVKPKETPIEVERL
jgi:hypothetical protein